MYLPSLCIRTSGLTLPHYIYVVSYCWSLLEPMADIYNKQ